jgi:hypothetical protein
MHHRPHRLGLLYHQRTKEYYHYLNRLRRLQIVQLENED